MGERDLNHQPADERGLNAMQGQPITLRTAARGDIRVSARTPGLRAIRLPACAAFAQDVLRRYAGRQGVWGGLGLVWRQMRVGGITYPLYWQPQINLSYLATDRAARDLLHTLQRIETPGPPTPPPERAPAPASVPVVRALARLPGMNTIMHLRWLTADGTLHRPEYRRAELLLRRLEVREQPGVIPLGRADQPPGRSGSGAGPEHLSRARSAGPEMISPPPPVVQTMAVQPVRRVFRRGAVAVALAENPAPVTASSAARRAEPAQPDFLHRSMPAAQTLNPAEINVLADRVLQTIDRRLAAHRERHGRR
jgi:hypothetical protein